MVSADEKNFLLIEFRGRRGILALWRRATEKDPGPVLCGDLESTRTKFGVVLRKMQEIVPGEITARLAEDSTQEQVGAWAGGGLENYFQIASAECGDVLCVVELRALPDAVWLGARPLGALN